MSPIAVPMVPAAERELVAEWWEVWWYGSALGAPADCHVSCDSRDEAYGEVRALRQAGRKPRVVHVRRYKLNGKVKK